MEEHCKWKFLAHAEGTAYSGRFKYLTQCKSVIIAHHLKSIQHYSHLRNSDPMSPLQNMVQVGPNFEGLAEAMDELLRDDAKAERIATHSYQFWRKWLNPASTNCAWRGLIREYAKLQDFKVEWRPDSDVSYASFESVVSSPLMPISDFVSSIMRTMKWDAF